jgi:uncharacterized protein (DUF2141 family)
MKRVSVYILPIAVLVYTGCATVVTPTGGPADTTPPNVTGSTLPNYSVNFKGNSFTLDFDELIDIKDPFGKVIISPPLKRAPDFRVKKKSLTVVFNDTLKERTTYNVNFGTSIADITEGNLLENFQYTFSTGPVLDSLEVRGIVRAAADLTPEKSILVNLYKENLDSLPYKQKPDYFARTDKDGRFTIRNLAPGGYKIVAVKDNNNNYLYEPGTEQIAFSDSLAVAGSIDSIRLFLFSEHLDKLRLEKAQNPEYGKILLVFNKPAPGLRLFTDIRLDTAGVIREHTKNKDSLILWYSNIQKDSIRFILRDSSFADTVKIGMASRESAAQSRGKAVPHKILTVNTNLRAVMDIYENIEFTFGRPVKDYDLQRMELEEDSVPIKNYILVAKDSASRRFAIAYPWKQGSAYELILPKGSFTDILGNTNDTIKGRFTVKPETSYGNLSIRLNVSDTTRSYIIQLIDEKDRLIRENSLSAPQLLEYKFLNPGKFRLRLVEDTNDNLKWDSGEYLKGIQPEKIKYYKEPIMIRENWDLELDWKI